MKKNRGCVRPTKRVVWTVKECVVCGGKNKKCKHCKGTNRISFNRCPKAMLQNDEAMFLLPYCHRYVEHGEFPDGKGLVDQPKVLIDLINVFTTYYRQFEKEEYENRLKALKNG